MRGSCRLAVLFTGLVATAPHLGAHGMECLFARVSPADGGAITVELTADIAGNPLIPDALQARRILAEAILVHLGDRDYPLDQLGTLTYEERTRFSDDAPIPPSANGSPHQLLTAIWHAQLPGLTVTFVTPVHTPHDVVLWNTAEAVPAGQSRWMLLICGEQSRAITLSGTTLPDRTALGGLVAAFALAAAGWLAYRWHRMGGLRRSHSATDALPHQPAGPGADTSPALSLR